MYDRIVLTYNTYETKEFGYTKTHVVIREMYMEDTAKHLEGTVDNKAGYQSQYAADRAARRFEAMLKHGHEVYFDHAHSGLEVHLLWQHYDRDEQGRQMYCDVSFENLGRGFRQIEEGMRFLRKIGRRIEKGRYGEVRGGVGSHTFSSPCDVLEALGRMRKSVQVQYDRGLEGWISTGAKILRVVEAA